MFRAWLRNEAVKKLLQKHEATLRVSCHRVVSDEKQRTSLRNWGNYSQSQKFSFTTLKKREKKDINRIHQFHSSYATQIVTKTIRSSDQSIPRKCIMTAQSIREKEYE